MISIITPTFNSEEYLEKCIQSIMAQDFLDYEHIVVDGGSTDGTVDILKKYENDVVSGGIIIIDSTLIGEMPERDDVTVFAVPATKMANDEGFSTLANMILMGKLIKESDAFSFDGTDEVLKKVVPPKKASLTEINLKALKTGYDY